MSNLRFPQVGGILTAVNAIVQNFERAPFESIHLHKARDTYTRHLVGSAPYPCPLCIEGRLRSPIGWSMVISGVFFTDFVYWTLKQNSRFLQL